jgi:hypothetical protein
VRYKNKVDVWIKIILIGVTFMFVPVFFFVPENELVILIISTVAMAVIIIPLFYGYIELGNEELVIKLSIFRQRIKYDNIKSIRMCTNFLSSMAMTKDRIEIKVHNKGYIMGTTFIGPENREEFFEELKRRCYHLETKKTH